MQTQNWKVRFIPLIMIVCVVVKSYYESSRLKYVYLSIANLGQVEKAQNATLYQKLTPIDRTLSEKTVYPRKTTSEKRSSREKSGLRRQNNSLSTRSLITNIVFIKLHKVGGSTFQSVLHRYARENLLSTANIKDKWPTKRHIFAHHSTLQEYQQNPIVQNPVFLTLLRNPLDHACSCFYWNWNGKQFRRETTGNFSPDHLHYLSVYSRQNGTSVVDDRNQKIVNLTYTRQWKWFANSSMDAIAVFGRLNFTIGFMEVKALTLRERGSEGIDRRDAFFLNPSAAGL
jgi:hypothetical protein